MKAAEVEPKERENFFTTTASSLINWARKGSLWPYPFGTACCAIEFMATVSSHYDIARFGSEVVRFSPKQSDVLMVLGTINDKMAPVLKQIYDQMAEPKWVISMGACATCGGFYRAYHVMQGIDEIIPVDVYIPGCPPVPEAVLDAVIKLQKQIEARYPPLLRTASAANADSRRPKSTPPSHGLEPPPRGSGSLPRRKAGNRRARSPRAFKERFPDDLIGMREFRGDLSISVKRENIKQVLRTLKNDPAFDFKMLLDVTAVDYLSERAERYDVVYHLLSLSNKHRVRIKAPVPADDPTIDSVVDVWKGADWSEREAFDMFGIQFKGHPDLRRILTHSQFRGTSSATGLPSRPAHDVHGDRSICRWSNAPGSMRSRWALAHPQILNLGPQHPAMHGTFRLQVAVDGERIIDADSEIGYLHRCFEKMSETHTYWQVIPFTDRLNYMSAMMNGVAYAMAVEKMFGVEIPKRAQYIRVILSEFSRIADHLVCIGTNLVDLGSISNFWYGFRPREEIYDLDRILLRRPSDGELRPHRRRGRRRSQRLRHARAAAARHDSEVRGRHREDEPSQQDLQNAHRRHYRDLRGRRDRLGLHRARCCAPAAFLTTFESGSRTTTTTSLSSIFRSENAAMSTIATSCASKKSGRA